MSERDITYGEYLKVPELLTLQRALSEPEHPDELHFIVVHQALELWFKLLLRDVERVIAALDADATETAQKVMRRANRVVESVVAQLRTLHELPPWGLHQFRAYLGTGSGLQSQQFRELELLSGLRDPHHERILRRLHDADDGEIPAPIARRLGQRSLCEAHLALGRRRGVERWEDVYLEPERFGDLENVSEALMEYDALWVAWRRAHVTMIERMLGPSTRGTAGMALTYLLRTTEYRFFPHLWDLRHDLAVRGGGVLVDGAR